MKRTEEQIDRHLRLWTLKMGEDSPEAQIVRQLREERDAARALACINGDDLSAAFLAGRESAKHDTEAQDQILAPRSAPLN